LLGLLEDKDPPPYLREEITLAMAKILGTEDEFYPLLVRLREDSTLAATLANDEAEAAIEHFLSLHGSWKRIARHSGTNPVLAMQAAAADTLMGAVSQCMLFDDGAPLARWLENLPDPIGDPILRIVFAQTVLFEDLSSFDRLRLLICQWACGLLRTWTEETANVD
jgi:hypothetical protein